MALRTSMLAGVFEKEGDANRWQIQDTDIQTPDTRENAIVVGWQPMQIAPDGLTRVWVGALRTQTYTGDRLDAIMADAAMRAATFIAAKQPAAVALYLGIRDALYAALQQDGAIPAEAK